MRYLRAVSLTFCVSLAASGQNSHPVFSPDLIRFVTPADNPSSPAKIELGRKLFSDKRLSADDTVACQTCHDPNAGFTARLATAKGIRDQVGKRNAPTAMNAMFFRTQFWDGRAPSLEEQAKLPILNPIEMGQKDGSTVVAKIAAIQVYADEFKSVFGRPINYDDLGRAIAAFERTLISSEAPIDRFLRGDNTALTAEQRRGWTVFNGKGRCNGCHAFNPTFPLFTDNRFHNIGVAAHNQNFGALVVKAIRSGATARDIDQLAIESDASELGRFLVTRNRPDIGAFKTPGLREIVLTAPYMHDGSQPSLWDVMDHYNKGGEANPFLDGGIQRLGLSEEEIDDLVALMTAFTSDHFAAQGQEEMERQRSFRAGPRKTRDTEAAMGRKGNLGDALQTPDQKDPAQIGGRPVAQ